MLEIAAKEGGADVKLQVADMRKLPRLGGFDLVLSLNDCVNYLLGDNDLLVALRRMRANLAENGPIAFDVNASSIYASGYTGVREIEYAGSRWVWKGRGEIAPSVFEAEIEGDRILRPIRQIARYRTESEVVDAMQAAGIRPVAALDMSEADVEVVLSGGPQMSNATTSCCSLAPSAPLGRAVSQLTVAQEGRRTELETATSFCALLGDLGDRRYPAMRQMMMLATPDHLICRT